MSVILIRLVQSFLLSLSFKSMGDCRHRSPALFKVLTRGPGEPSKKSYHGAVGRPFPSVPKMTHWSSWQSVLNVIQMFPFKQILDFVTSCVACRCQLRKGLPKRNSSKNVPINHKVIHFWSRHWAKLRLEEVVVAPFSFCISSSAFCEVSAIRSIGRHVFQLLVSNSWRWWTWWTTSTFGTSWTSSSWQQLGRWPMRIAAQTRALAGPN